MGRLETHQQKQFKRQLYFFGILFIIIIVLLYNFGLKILLGGSFYLTNLLGGGQKDTPTQEQFLGELRVTDIPAATNSAQIQVKGYVQSFDRVEFYVNGTQAKKITTTDTFSEEIGDLNAGDNNIIVRAYVANDNQKQKKQEFTVVYSNSKPKLEVTDPQDNTRVNNYEINVKGKTNPSNEVMVKGSPVVVTADGSFSTFVRLNEGENKIEITAKDNAGNMEKKILTITYDKDS